MRYIYSARPRWWYLSLSNCNSPRYSLNYSLTFTNGDTFFDKHFSADEAGILEMNLITTSVMLLLLFGSVVYALLLGQRKLYHRTFKTYQASVFFYLCSCVLLAVYYSLIGRDGKASISLYIGAQICIVLSTTCFLGLLLMFSKGYSIVVSTLSTRSFTEVMIFTATFSMLMLYCVIWEQGAFDPADVLYLYESPPGYLLIGLYFPVWLYFIYNCVKVGVKFAQKRNFYGMLVGFYSLWLLVVPSIILLCNKWVEDWARMKIVFISQQAVWILSYLYLFILFTPTRSNKNFPFHMRATHVSDGTDLQAAQNNYDVTVTNANAGDMFRVGYDKGLGAFDPNTLGLNRPKNGFDLGSVAADAGSSVSKPVKEETGPWTDHSNETGTVYLGDSEQAWTQGAHIYDSDLTLVSGISNGHGTSPYKT